MAALRSLGVRLLGSTAPSVLKWLVKRVNASPHFSAGEPELKLLPYLVPPGRQAVDIGAHKGLYSIILEQLVGTARIALFEPIPSLYPHLRRLFPTAAIYRVAASSRSGTQLLSIPKIGSATRLSQATLESDDHAADAQFETFTVETKRLDDYLAEGALYDVGFIKIDVEGHELDVLDGASELIERCRPQMIIEIEERRAHRPVRATFEFIESKGYDVLFYSRVEGKLTSVREFEPERHQHEREAGTPRYINNFVCLPSGETEEILRRLMAGCPSRPGTDR